MWGSLQIRRLDFLLPLHYDGLVPLRKTWVLPYVPTCPFYPTDYPPFLHSIMDGSVCKIKMRLIVSPWEINLDRVTDMVSVYLNDSIDV